MRDPPPYWNADVVDIANWIERGGADRLTRARGTEATDGVPILVCCLKLGAVSLAFLICHLIPLVGAACYGSLLLPCWWSGTHCLSCWDHGPCPAVTCMPYGSLVSTGPLPFGQWNDLWPLACCLVFAFYGWLHLNCVFCLLQTNFIYGLTRDMVIWQIRLALHNPG